MLAALLAMGGRAQAPPALDVRPARLSFIADETRRRFPPQRVEIRNSGEGQLVWRAVSSDPWIVVIPDRGVAPAEVLVTIDPSDLAAGSYAGRVTIDAGSTAGSPRVVDVAVTVVPARPPAPPAITVAPDRVTFSAVAGQTDKLAFTIKVAAEREAAVRWSARANEPWLSLAPGEGTTPAELIVTAAPATLPPGDHSGSIVIRGAGEAPPRRVSVRLTIPAGGGPLTFSTTTLPLATLNLPYSEPVPVRSGRAPYFFQLAAGQLPPDLGLANGVITGVPRQPGTHVLAVAVTDSSTPPASVTERLTLTVVILDRSTALSVTPDRVALSARRGQMAEAPTLSVTSGGPPLSWSIRSDVSWLRVTPADGVAPATVTVGADTTDLAAGSYAATLIVSMRGAPNSPVRVPVQLSVR